LAVEKSEVDGIDEEGLEAGTGEDVGQHPAGLGEQHLGTIDVTGQVDACRGKILQHEKAGIVER
jgi:hypothetical protein